MLSISRSSSSSSASGEPTGAAAAALNAPAVDLTRTGEAGPGLTLQFTVQTHSGTIAVWAPATLTVDDVLHACQPHVQDDLVGGCEVSLIAMNQSAALHRL